MQFNKTTYYLVVAVGFPPILYAGWLFEEYDDWTDLNVRSFKWRIAI